MRSLITITGNVGTDLERFTSRQGKHIATFRLACTPRVLRDGVWVDRSTTWIKVAAYGTLADNLVASIRRGDPVIVSGELRLETWEGEGGKRERMAIDAETVGHDLSRGVGTFSRSGAADQARDEQPGPVPESPVEVEAGDPAEAAA